MRGKSRVTHHGSALPLSYVGINYIIVKMLFFVLADDYFSERKGSKLDLEFNLS